MLFTQKVKFYKFNDDNTISVYVTASDGKVTYYRMHAKFTMLQQIYNLPQDTEMIATIGLYYNNGKLALQLVEVAYE